VTDERLEEIREVNAQKKHGHADSAVRHCDELLREVDRLRSIGTPLARLDALGKWAEEVCGHPPLSAAPFEATIVEYFDRLRAELAAARENSARLKDALLSIRTQFSNEVMCEPVTHADITVQQFIDAAMAAK
jgi:hypothetical protein